jgi:23S rRNA (guanosine2251-2'-O)-methyltransferase
MKEWLYGKRTVLEHLQTLPDTCERLVVARGAKPDPEILEAAKAAGVAVEELPREKLDALAIGGNHQGVCLRVGGWEYAELDTLIERTRRPGAVPILFILDSVQDPRNLGAVARVADGVGAGGLIIAKDRAAGLTASAARSAAGALASIPVAQVVNIARTIRELRDEGFFVMGTAPEGTELFKAKIFFPLAIVLGAEDKGLRPNVAANCDILASLPMEGKVSSLNISVAAGVFGYEALRRFRAQA